MRRSLTTIATSVNIRAHQNPKRRKALQLLIDTATDSAAELYRIGKFLVDNYETVAVEPACEASPEAPAVRNPAHDLPSAFNPVIASVVDSDPEVETDEEPAMVAEVVLVAPPPPAPVVYAGVPNSLGGPIVAASTPLLTHDKRGMPWDGRIHASNRATKIGGEWKNRRGVDPALVAQVEATLVPVPGNTAAPLAPAPQTADTATGLATSIASAISAPVSAPVAPPAPPPRPAPLAATPSAVPSTVAAPTAFDFQGLMRKVQAHTSAGKLTIENVNAILASVGLKPEELGSLIGNAALIASVNAALDVVLSG